MPFADAPSIAFISIRDRETPEPCRGPTLRARPLSGDRFAAALGLARRAVRRCPVLLLALAACSAEQPIPPDRSPAADSSPPAAAPPAPRRAARWDLGSGGAESELVLTGSADERIAGLFCPSGEGRLIVNVQAFTPVASEERMSLGSGGVVVALVADPAGDGVRGGVSGEGPAPIELAGILAGEDGVAVNYGAQDVGPFPVVPAGLARDFVAGCAA